MSLKLKTSSKHIAISNGNIITNDIHYEVSNIHKNHHGFHHTSVKKWGAT